MAEQSLYQTFRRRIAPIALICALAALGTRTCERESAEVTLRFDTGQAPVSDLRVDVFRPGERQSVAFFEDRQGTTRQPGSMASFSARLDSGPYELFILARLPSGTRQLTRQIEVVNHATITVNLERDLEQAEPPSSAPASPEVPAGAEGAPASLPVPPSPPQAPG